MLKDVLDSITKSIQDERTQEQLNIALGPITYRIKMFSTLLVIILIALVINFVYMNVLLYDIRRNVINCGPVPMFSN